MAQERAKGMIITGETILKYAEDQAKENDPTGKYDSVAYTLGTMASIIAFALNSPAEMRQLRRELQKLQEKGQP